MSPYVSHTSTRTAGPAGLLVATLVALLAALLAPAPSYADTGAFCTGGKGVSVVVDFQDLGGGVTRACDESGAGKTAQQVFEDSGFELTPVGAFPGAACRIDGKPADAPCAQMPPADAYWGLYLAAGGKWDYAPKGADQLSMKDGDFVGFSWQSTKTSTPPGAEPVAASPGQGTARHSDGVHESQDDGGLAWWIPVAVVAALAGAAGAVVVRRRSRSATGS